MERDLLPEPDDPDFDREFGTDTAGIVHPEDLGLSAPLERGCVAYEATTPAAFACIVGELLELLPRSASRYTFVDIGCGKGRVVLMASEIPFRAVVGVEASAELVRISRQNLIVFPRERRRCGNVRVEESDVSAYELPAGPLVLFLFNPFDARVMAKFLVRVRRSLERGPRDLWMLYLNPRLRHLVGRARFLARVQRGTGLPQGEHDIYRAVPPLRRPVPGRTDAHGVDPDRPAR
jgi:SAM-dependent methyltransferase